MTRSLSSRTRLVAAAAVAAYLPALGNRYAFDDVYIVARDPAIRSLANVAALFHRDWWAPFGRMGLYRPLTKLTFALGWAAAPDSPGGYHLVNILLHALAAVLVFRLARRWLLEAFAALAALWFALVPTQVEVVAGLVGRADLLAFVFALLALLSYLRLEEQPPSQLSRRWLWELAAGACTLLSLLSKESAIVLPGVAALAGWLLPREEAAPLAFRPRLRRLLANPALFSLPAGAVAYLALRLRIVGLLTRPPDFADNALWYLGPATRVRTAVVILVKNFFAWLWPFRLAPDYSWPQLPAIRTWASPPFLASGLLLVALAAVLWRLRRHRALLFGVLFALLTLLPVSNLLFAIGTIRANRLLYLPSAGMALAVGWLAQQVWERWCAVPAATLPSSRAERRRAQATSGRRKLSPRQRTAVLACGLVLLSYGFADAHESGFWKDNATLFAMGVERSPHSSRMRYSLGVELQEEGRWADSAAQLRQATALYDGSAQAQAALGDALDHLGERAQALAAYESAWRLQPNSDRFLQLADEQLKIGDDAAVLAERRQLDGTLSPLEDLAVGLAQLHLGQFAAAATTLQPVVAALPGNARAHLYYGRALHGLGRDAEAGQQLLWLREHVGTQGR